MESKELGIFVDEQLQTISQACAEEKQKHILLPGFHIASASLIKVLGNKPA